MNLQPIDYLYYHYILSWVDLIVAPVVALILLGIVYNRKKTKYKGSPIGKYLVWAWVVRIIGATLSATMYAFYYGYGDTFGYYGGSIQLTKVLINLPSTGLNILLNDYEDYSQLGHLYMNHHFMKSPSEAIIIKMGSIISLFTFGSYLSISYIISFFALLGSWKMYRTFNFIYPHLHKELAIAILFIPSIFFWGTGLMKDPIVLGALGYLVYSTHSLFFLKKQKIKNILLVIISTYLLVTIKVYIIVAFYPPFILWFFLKYKNKIRNKVFRRLSSPIFLLFSVGLLVTFYNLFKDSLGKYSLENVVDTISITSSYLKSQTELAGGSGYDLGEFDPSFLGLLSKVPKAINVTLFRPYLWEIKKVINIPAAFESFLTLLFTIYVLLKLGLIKTIKTIFNNPELLFCLGFSLVLAFAAGLSTSNFGSLVRYKLPCIPFYFIALVILYDKHKQKRRIIKSYHYTPPHKNES